MKTIGEGVGAASMRMNHTAADSQEAICSDAQALLARVDALGLSVAGIHLDQAVRALGGIPVLGGSIAEWAGREMTNTSFDGRDVGAPAFAAPCKNAWANLPSAARLAPSR